MITATANRSRRFPLRDNRPDKKRRLARRCQVTALPDEKSYRKREMPQIENGTQIIVRTPQEGCPNGGNNARATGRNAGI
jgi:hypothetical protein